MKKISIILILFFLLVFDLKSSDIKDFKITPLIENALLHNRLYIKKKRIKNSPWPEITIITLIDASPLQCASIFFAYDEHKNFIPDLLVSKPIKYITPTQLHIYFEMHLPWPLKNSRFITSNILKKSDNGGYEIRWKFVKSDSAKDGYGGVYFIPYEKKTILIYNNYTLPKSGLAKIFKKSMYKKVKNTVKAIKNYIENIIKTKKNRIPKYIENFNKALNGKYVYKNIVR